MSPGAAELEGGGGLTGWLARELGRGLTRQLGSGLTRGKRVGGPFAPGLLVGAEGLHGLPDGGGRRAGVGLLQLLGEPALRVVDRLAGGAA